MVSFRSSPAEVFLRKGVLKICSKCTGEHPCRSVISKKLQSTLESTLRHGCSPVNLLHFFRTPFLRNTSGELLLYHCVETGDRMSHVSAHLSVQLLFCINCLFCSLLQIIGIKLYWIIVFSKIILLL